MPHSHNIPDPVGSRFTPSRRRGQARGGFHSSGPSETTGSRIPLVSAAGTTNRQRVEKLCRPSSTSFLIRLSLAKRRPNKGIREAADDVGISGASLAPFPFPLSLSLFSVSLSLPSLPPHLQPPPKTHLSSTVFTVTYAHSSFAFSVSLSLSLPPSPSRISMLPSPARELHSGIPGICLDNAPWLARYSALFYAVRGALAAAPHSSR